MYVMLHAVSLTLVKTSITLYECTCMQLKLTQNYSRLIKAEQYMNVIKLSLYILTQRSRP